MARKLKTDSTKKDSLLYGCPAAGKRPSGRRAVWLVN